MSKHWAYFKYVTTHRWFVFLECRRLGLTWRGIIHDLSKFRWSEWNGYVNWFYGIYGVRWNDAGFESSGERCFHPWAKDAFDKAWLLHKHRNPHHGQFWLGDDGEPLEMPTNDALEMVIDWKAMAYARGRGWNATPWYDENKDKMVLHPRTRDYVESVLSWEALNGS